MSGSVHSVFPSDTMYIQSSCIHKEKDSDPFDLQCIHLRFSSQNSVFITGLLNVSLLYTCLSIQEHLLLLSFSVKEI